MINKGFIIDPPPNPNVIDPIPIPSPNRINKKQFFGVYLIFPELIFSKAFK